MHELVSRRVLINGWSCALFHASSVSSDWTQKLEGGFKVHVCTTVGGSNYSLTFHNSRATSLYEFYNISRTIVRLKRKSGSCIGLGPAPIDTAGRFESTILSCQWALSNLGSQTGRNPAQSSWFDRESVTLRDKIDPPYRPISLLKNMGAIHNCIKLHLGRQDLPL